MSAGKREPELDPSAKLTIGEDDGRLKLSIETKVGDVYAYMSPEQAIELATSIIAKAGSLARAARIAKGAIG